MPIFSIEDDFMAWATIFWENVCRKYELVINADGSSYDTFVEIECLDEVADDLECDNTN
jgi:hypothetical protein